MAVVQEAKAGTSGIGAATSAQPTDLAQLSSQQERHQTLINDMRCLSGAANELPLFRIPSHESQGSLLLNLNQHIKEEQARYQTLYQNGAKAEHDPVSAVIGIVLNDLSGMFTPKQLGIMAGILGANVVLGMVPGAGPALSLGFDAILLGTAGVASMKRLAEGIAELVEARTQGSRELAAAHIVEGVIGIATAALGARTLPTRFPKAMLELKRSLSSTGTADLALAGGGGRIAGGLNGFEGARPMQARRSRGNGSGSAPDGFHSQAPLTTQEVLARIDYAQAEIRELMEGAVRNPKRLAKTIPGLKWESLKERITALAASEHPTRDFAALGRIHKRDDGYMSIDINGSCGDGVLLFKLATDGRLSEVKVLNAAEHVRKK